MPEISQRNKIMKKAETNQTSDPKPRFNFFDLFLILLILLAVGSVYFSLFRPVQFSHLIKREDIKRYAEATLLLPDDLFWMKEKLSPGEEWRDVFGQLDWRILAITEETIAGRPWVALKVKLLVLEKGPGIIHYGKYTLASGSKIILINSRYMVEGRVLNYRLLDEKVLS